MTNQQKHRIRSEAAETVSGWLQTRGGVLVWRSVDLCDPCKVWTSPAQEKDGKPYGKPSWQCESSPSRHITDPNDIEVAVLREVKRFRVAVRMGASGTRVKLTDASSAKLRRALDKAGVDSTYQFDYMTQEAVIFAPDRIVLLPEYLTGLKKAS